MRPYLGVLPLVLSALQGEAAKQMGEGGRSEPGKAGASGGAASSRARGGALMLLNLNPPQQRRICTQDLHALPLLASRPPTAHHTAADCFPHRNSAFSAPRICTVLAGYLARLVREPAWEMRRAPT